MVKMIHSLAFIPSKSYASKFGVNFSYPTNSGFSFEARKVQSFGIWWGAEKLVEGAMKSTPLETEPSQC